MTSAVMPTYARAPIAFVKGEGCHLTARDGRRYLDFAGGIAVCALGHAHPRLVAALHEQAQRLWHCSNMFEVEHQEAVAAKLAELTFGDLVFFANSGAEANECAIKIARRFHAAAGHPERYRVLAFKGSFHGRTLATLAAAGNPKNLDGFGPVVDGFDHAPYGDLAAATAAVGPHTAAILVEPIQGEGGIRVPDPAFLTGLRALADKTGALLMFDEVQCGMGRAGHPFAADLYDVRPDMITTAKALGNGFPCAALLMTPRVTGAIKPESLGTTFGGGPMACAAIEAVIEAIEGEDLLANVRRVSRYVRETCGVGPVTGFQGEGFLLGLRMDRPAREIQAALLERDILAGTSGDPQVLRLLPPFILREEHVDQLKGALAAL